MIEEDVDGIKWMCTNFYGTLEESLGDVSWDLLRSLNDCSSVPWVVIGDFNEIAYSFEK